MPLILKAFATRNNGDVGPLGCTTALFSSCVFSSNLRGRGGRRGGDDVAWMHMRHAPSCQISCHILSKDNWSTGGGDTGMDDLFGFGEPEPGAGISLMLGTMWNLFSSCLSCFMSSVHLYNFFRRSGWRKFGQKLKIQILNYSQHALNALIRMENLKLRVGESATLHFLVLVLEGQEVSHLEVGMADRSFFIPILKSR